VFSSDDDAVQLFAFPKTIAGNLAVTLIVQTLLTTMIGGALAWEDVWQRRVAPLSSSAAPCACVRRVLAAQTTIEADAGALAREAACCAGGRPRLPQPLGLAPDVRPATPAASLVSRSCCCRGCSAFFVGLCAWATALPDPIHYRSLTELGRGGARTRAGLWTSLGGLVVRGLFFAPFLFVVFWPLFVGVIAAIYGSDGDEPPRGVYNKFPQPEIILTVYGFTLAAVSTPLLSFCVLFRAARVATAQPP
jgi:hypothetical protein